MGAGAPAVLALLFAVCAPLRLQAGELGEWPRGPGTPRGLWASGEPASGREISGRPGWAVVGECIPDRAPETPSISPIRECGSLAPAPGAACAVSGAGTLSSQTSRPCPAVLCLPWGAAAGLPEKAADSAAVSRASGWRPELGPRGSDPMRVFEEVDSGPGCFPR